MSERASIEAGKYTVVEFPDHREIDTEANRLTFLYNLSYSEKRRFEKDEEDYDKYLRLIRRTVSQAYQVLWDICHSSMQNRIKASPDYQSMNIGDIFTLKEVIENISIGSAALIVEDIMGNYMENLLNFL